MSYINETDFVIENKKLVYPEIVADGLQLYYDAKGKRDTDYHRDTMLDMSGNKNHGKLHNFAYEKHSGYKDGLVFDYIDDKLVRPKLNLKPDDFTFMLNGNIISFSPDGTIKRVQDGEVIESKGFNLVRNGNFWNGTTGWGAHGSTIAVEDNKGLKVTNNGSFNYAQTYGYLDLEPQNKYYFRTKIEEGNRDTKVYIAGWFDGGVKSSEGLYELVKENISEETVRRQLKFSDISTAGDYYYIKNIQLINLTTTFGAGNEPTKEQMGEIINRFGFIPNAQDLIDRIEYKGNTLGDMENIIDGLYKTEVLTGEEVYTDKADDAVVHVDIDGKSYQNAGSGKNLFTVPYSNAIKDFSRPQDYWVKPITLKANTQYYFSSKLVGNLIEGTTIMVWSGGDKYVDKGTSYTVLSVNGVERAVTFNTGDVTEWKIAIYLTSDLESSKELLGELLDNYQIQLEEGSVATAYEPPAPTPDYPIEIHNLNDFDVVSSGVGRNYVLSSDFSDGWNNWLNSSGSRGTFVEYDTHPGKKFLRIDNSDGSLSNPFVQSYTSVGEAGKYTLSWLQKGTGNIIIQNASEENGNLTPRVQGIFTGDFSRHSLTLDIEEGNPKARIVFQSFDGNDISVTNVKLEKGNVATDWTPAPEDITEDSNHPYIDKINLLLGEPLRSLGDVKDRLFRDSDGVWNIERNIYSETLNAETGLTIANIDYDSDLTSNRWVTPKYRLSSLSTHSITSHFKRETSVWFSDRVGHVVNSGNQYHLNFPNKLLGILESDSASVREDKISNWLQTQYDKGTPVVIEGVLVEPNTELLSDELQDKLNNLRSFEDSNYVYTVLPNEDNYLSNNLKPTLHAKFLYNNWYKEDRVINNLMIYNRALTNEEMLQNYKTIKRRWGM